MDHEPAVTRSPFRPVLIALSCVALTAALGGCGRKGGLDLPPQAQAQAQASVAPAPVAVANEPPALPGSFVDQSLREADPPPAQRSKRKFILDPLLD